MTDNTRIRTNSLGVRIERIAVGTSINYRPAGIAQIIKAVYDTEHNDKYAASEGTSNA